jgi:hypothetical protein
MTPEDRKAEIILTLIRMRQESDARIQAMMADRPSVPPLYRHGNKFDADVAELQACIAKHIASGVASYAPLGLMERANG